MRTISERSRRPAAERTFWRQHLVLILAILGISASCLVFIAYSNWNQQEQAKAASINSAQEIARIDQQIKDTLKKRVEDARKAEADAKAKAIVAQKTSAPTTQTTSEQCDVSDPASITVVINKKTLL